MFDTIARAENAVRQYLALADIIPNGPRPWDIQVHDERFYELALKYRGLGMGESYMNGWWDCDSIDEMVCHILQTPNPTEVTRSPRFVLSVILNRLFNRQCKIRAKEVAERHYDKGNRLFQAMLDKEMVYSCGYWSGGATTLDQAQTDKLDLICRKLQLSPGMRLLDIGCGWGGLAKYAAEHFGVEVVGITISVEQKVLADERCKGLPIEIRLQDYRDMQGQFDRVVSVGMFEHVGYKNYDLFMRVAHRCLVPGGLFLLHTIGQNVTNWAVDPWIHKYIFPNGMLPSIAQLAVPLEGLFVMEDWHNFGADYDKTLMAWYHNFTQRWDSIKENYDDRFFRMWTYYLLSCAGAFRARDMQLWQIVLSKGGVKGGYRFRYQQS